MRVQGVSYRARQFWNALSASPDPGGLELARKVLNPGQLALFSQMQPSEQKHSLAVMKQLSSRRNETDRFLEPHHQDLLVAALLHDIGKCLHPLRLLERVLVVLGKQIFPAQADRWGNGSPHGWRRAFVIARQHPEWGAALASQEGCSPLTCELIRCHQTYLVGKPVYLLDRLLLELQAADRNC